MKRTLHVLLSLLALAGCEPATTETPTSSFAPNEGEYKLAIVVDMSGSFADLMAEGGKAHEFLLEVIDTYFRDRIGSQDKIIIAQISANEKALIWEGTPLELRSEFDPHWLQVLLREHSDPNGSPVHQSIANTLEYLMADSNVSTGKAKSAFFVLSDMLDNWPKTAEMKDRVLSDLQAYGKLGGTVGIYYCDQQYVAAWQRILNEAGIKQSRVECGIVSKPDLPSFEN